MLGKVRGQWRRVRRERTSLFEADIGRASMRRRMIANIIVPILPFFAVAIVLCAPVADEEDLTILAWFVGVALEVVRHIDGRAGMTSWGAARE